MFRTAFTAPFSSADVSTVTKATSPQTSPAVPMMCEDGRPILTDPVTGRRLCPCHLLPEGAHSHLHAAGALPGGLKSLAMAPGSTVPTPGLESAAFYNPLMRGLPVRPERLAQCLTPAAPPIGLDSALAAAATHPYGLLYAGLDMNGLGMRKAATRETTGPLKAWLHEHRKNPYPTKAEKIMLAIITKMTLTQVSTWFANARRRLKKESRLYTGRDTDNDDHDDDLNDKDADDTTDTEGASGSLREHCESEEDINVDISDVSDNEDTSTATTTTTTTSSSSSGHPLPLPTTDSVNSPTPTTATPVAKPSSHSSPSSFSALSPPYLSTTPQFRSSFVPRPGPFPDFPHTTVPRAETLCEGAALRGGPGRGGLNGLSPFSSPVHRDLAESGQVKASVSGPHAPSSLSRSSAASGGSPVVAAPRPKIWSISEIIHSDSASPAVKDAAPSSAGPGEGAPFLNGAEKLLLLRESPVMTPVAQTAMAPAGPRPELLQHGLASPFRTLEPSSARLASRHPSGFLVAGGVAGIQGWRIPPAGLRLAQSSHVVGGMANGTASSGEGSLDGRSNGSPVGMETAGKRSPQTEALDLHTEKEGKDGSADCT